MLPVVTTSDPRRENLGLNPVCPGAREPTGTGRRGQLLFAYVHVPQGPRGALGLQQEPSGVTPSLLGPLPSQLQQGT